VSTEVISPPMNPKISKIIHEVRSLFILVVIVLTLKVTIFELYIVPTGSMENTIMTGDFLAGNRFVYGMRTPEWIGIPYTDIGFDIPSIKFPSFREPKRGDVIIFKFPRDTKQKYVKRCVAEPGDTLEVNNKLIYINGSPYPLPENGKFIMSPISPDFTQQDIFLGDQGNKDYFKPLRMPMKGDRIAVSPENTKLLLHLMLLDGHELKLVNGQQKYPFTMVSPDELYRRKGKCPYMPLIILREVYWCLGQTHSQRENFFWMVIPLVTSTTIQLNKIIIGPWATIAMTAWIHDIGDLCRNLIYWEKHCFHIFH